MMSANVSRSSCLRILFGQQSISFASALPTGGAGGCRDARTARLSGLSDPSVFWRVYQAAPFRRKLPADGRAP